MYPHRIRLHGPWEYEPLARLPAAPDRHSAALAEPLPPRGRMMLPGRWNQCGLGDFAGRVRFRRRFGWPAHLAQHECVWLTCAGVEGAAEVWLNAVFLGRVEAAGGPFEFDITSLLHLRNELIVEVEAPAGNGGLWGEVALEVRCRAFLRGLRLWATEVEGSALLHVAGEVAGACEQALELYVLLNGATILYASLEAGQPFHVVSGEIDRRALEARSAAAEPIVRLDLVHGAVLWYTIEQPFAFPPAPS